MKFKCNDGDELEMRTRYGMTRIGNEWNGYNQLHRELETSGMDITNFTEMNKES
jgi:hypothetical protein